MYDLILIILSHIYICTDKASYILILSFLMHTLISHTEGRGYFIWPHRRKYRQLLWALLVWGSERAQRLCLPCFLLSSGNKKLKLPEDHMPTPRQGSNIDKLLQHSVVWSYLEQPSVLFFDPYQHKGRAQCHKMAKETNRGTESFLKNCCIPSQYCYTD